MTTSTVLALNLSIVATIVCWGVWGIFDKKALSRSTADGVFVAMLALQIVEIPVAYVLLNTTHPGWSIARDLPFWTALGSVAYGVSLLAYLGAMVRAEASFVLGFTAAYPVVTQLLAVAFLNEQLVPQRMLGGALVALGVFAIGLSKSQTPPRQDAKAQSPPLQEIASTSPSTSPRLQKLIVSVCVGIATLTWGIKGLIDKKAVSLGTPLEVYLMEAIFNSLLLVPMFAYYRYRKTWPKLDSRKTWLFACLSATSLAIGSWTYLVAMSLASASYVITITGCYPLLMYLLALIWLKEQFNRVRFAGIILVVIGGVIVQSTQG